MEFLLRDDAPFAQGQWDSIDNLVIKTAKQVLTGRKFINIYGPLGAGVQSINFDEWEKVSSGDLDFFGDDDNVAVKSKGRKFVEIPLLYKDFSLSWRDIETSKQMGLPLDLSAAASAAALCARKEDELIFLGNTEFGYEGLLNASGVKKIEKSNWMEGENPFTDVAKGLEILTSNGFVGRFALAVSPDLYMQMQRTQHNTGLLEIERVKKLVDGNLYQTPVLGVNKAVLVCSEPQNMDLVIGQDLITAYLGPEKLNHTLRILETVLLRIKRKDSVIVFE